MKIQSLELKNNQKINLGKISILVGANNVGKSQTLRDIQGRMQDGLPSKFVLLKKIVFEKPKSFEELLSTLKVADSPNHLNNKIIIGINNNLTTLDSYEFNYDWAKNKFKEEDNLDW